MSNSPQALATGSADARAAFVHELDQALLHPNPYSAVELLAKWGEPLREYLTDGPMICRHPGKMEESE